MGIWNPLTAWKKEITIKPSAKLLEVEILGRSREPRSHVSYFQYHKAWINAFCHLALAPLFGLLPQQHFPLRELHPRLGRGTRRAELLYSPGKWLSQTEALHLPRWSEQSSSGSFPAAGHWGSADRLYWTMPANEERHNIRAALALLCLIPLLSNMLENGLFAVLGVDGLGKTEKLLPPLCPGISTTVETTSGTPDLSHLHYVKFSTSVTEKLEYY